MKKIRSYPTLKAWRAALGLNQRDAALLLGVSQSLYARAESGTNSPRPQRAKNMSEKTGVSFETLMGVA